MEDTLKLISTRWLSLERCVNRTVSQWPALKAYFERCINRTISQWPALKACFERCVNRTISQWPALKAYFERCIKRTISHSQCPRRSPGGAASTSALSPRGAAISHSCHTGRHVLRLQLPRHMCPHAVVSGTPALRAARATQASRAMLRVPGRCVQRGFSPPMQVMVALRIFAGGAFQLDIANIATRNGLNRSLHVGIFHYFIFIYITTVCCMLTK